MINAALIKQELDASPKGARTAIVRRYAENFGVSPDTIYRQMRREFGPAKKVVREKKIEDRLIDEVAKLKVSGMNLGLSTREISTELCIDILQGKGVPGADKLTVTTVNRRLKEKGFRQKEPIKRVEAKYANEQHQLDFSRSKYFQLFRFDSTRGDYLLKVSGKSLSYKEDEHKLRTWLVGLTDAYSRVSLTKAYAATGESALIGIEFLNHCYGRPEDEHPLRFICDTLKTDNGSFIKDRSVKALLEKMEIESELVLPYKKHGIQKREAAWRELWQRFELPLALRMGEGKTIYLDEYNELLHEHMIELLDYDHPLKMETRGHTYRASLTANPPRIIEVDLKEIIAKPDYRTVNQSLLISIKNQKFQCPEKTINQRIRVYKNLYGDMIGELVDEYSKPFVLKPVDGYVHTGDFEHRANATYKQKIENEVKAEKKAEKQAGKIKFIEPRVSKVEVENKFSDAIENTADYNFPDIYSAQVYIGGKLSREESYSDYAYAFDELLEETLNRGDIDRVLNEIKSLKLYKIG